VASVTVPGQDGYFTVMGDHAPVMVVLKPGFVTVHGEGGKDDSYYVEGGFADVSPTRLTILADSARPIADYDHSEIEAQIKRAEENLASAESHEDRDAAQTLLDAWKNLVYDATHMGQAVGRI
jgi:F-type H+-transporting ATPase subunit epsilon